MQVSTRISYPDPGPARQRVRSWGERVMPVTADERGAGYRGTLARSSHQAVNDRAAGGSADKEVFVARSLSSTLAMLQMHAAPQMDESGGAAAAPSDEPVSLEASLVQDLLSGVLGSYKAQ